MTNPGKKFEQFFMKSIPDEVYFMRIKDSANNFSRSSQSKFASKNPFDLFIVYNGKFLPMELKSTKGKSFSIQTDKLENGKDIKFHQIKELTRSGNYSNIIPGFVLDFRGSNTYWISIFDFNTFLCDTTKKSINEADVIHYKGILVDKKLLRVNYKYNILEMLENILIGVKDYGTSHSI